MAYPTIFSYITGNENSYETEEVRVGDNWNWNMRDHIQLIFHLMNSQFYTGENDYLRAFKAVMEPIVELANWTEDIELKDIVLYTEGKDDRVLSFLLKKYHEDVFARKHNLDEYIDRLTEDDNTYGGFLTQKSAEPKPEVIELTSIAFCNQSDVEDGAIGFKHQFSPDAIRAKAALGWGDPDNGATITCDELAVLADEYVSPAGLDEKKNKGTGKVIDVYIVKGGLPEHYLLDNDNMEDWYGQVHVVAFYTKKDGKKEGVILYRQKEEESTLKFFTSTPVANRALGRSVAEKMLHPQIWTNYLTIHKMNFMEAASKVPLVTDDESYANRNEIQDMENLEVTTIQQGSFLQSVQTASPANIAALSNSVNEWMESAQFQGAAQDPLMGVQPVSGSTFRGQERAVAQGRGPHDRKRGKRAKFIEEIWREMVIPQMVKEITAGQKFMASLTNEELSWVREQLATSYANKRMKELTMDFSKPLPTEVEREEMKTFFKEQFSKGGNKRMLEILKDQFKDVEIKIGINVANKQKNLADLSDKVLSIFQFAMANPQGFQQAMQIPALAQSFNDILEFSGMNQANFMSLVTPPEQVQLPEQAAPAGPQGAPAELALNNQAQNAGQQ